MRIFCLEDLETVLNFTNQNNFGTKAILSSSFLSFFVSSNFQISQIARYYAKLENPNPSKND